jgi:hypothetical protein
MQQLVTRLGSVTLMAGLMVSSVACVDTGSTVFIRQVQAVTADDDCIVQPDPSALFRGSGFLDTSVGDGGYQAVLLVGNQMAQRGDAEQLKPETGRIQFYEVETEILDASGNSLGDVFFQTVSGFADPATNTDPGYGLVAATLIPGSMSAGLSGTIVSRVIIRGTSLGGNDVETGFWDFPIEVCNGCLRDSCLLPASCDDDIEPVCNLGQDALHDCRYVQATNPCAGP